MVTPSALNVLVIGASVIIFGFLWRMLAAQWKDNSFGKAMAVIW
jgi:hypothetical protein